MTRKIYVLATTNVTFATGAIALPSGSRLVYIQGEADGKPTYDFTITGTKGYVAAGTITVLGQSSCRYVGTKNGAKVQLWKEWPQLSTTSSDLTGRTGLYDQITVTAGTGVNLQVFYDSGTTSTT